MLVLASVCPSIPSSNQRASLLDFTPFLGVYLHTKATATFENIVVIMWQLDSPDTLSMTYVLHDMTQQPSDIITQPISLVASGMQLPPSALNTCLGSLAQIHCPLFTDTLPPVLSQLGLFFQTSLQITATVTSRPFPASPVALYDIILTYFSRKFFLLASL